MLDRLKRFFSGGAVPTRRGDEGFGWNNDWSTDTPDSDFRVELDRTRQVLRLDCGEALDFGPVLATTPAEPVAAGPTFVSASMLTQKAKQFDDGLYAAIEAGNRFERMPTESFLPKMK